MVTPPATGHQMFGTTTCLRQHPPWVNGPNALTSNCQDQHVGCVSLWLVNQLHRATSVGKLFAHLWDMISIHDIIALKNVATHPMDHRNFYSFGDAQRHSIKVDSRPNIKEDSIRDVLNWIMTQIATRKAFDTWRKLSLGHRDRLGHQCKRSCNM